MGQVVKKTFQTARQVSALTILCTAAFFAALFFVLDGVEVFLPGWSAWRRFLATIGFGFLMVGTIISMIYAAECLIGAASQRSVRPTLESRVGRYPSVSAWCIALAGTIALILLKT